ncbi:MAG: hypothetical protein ABJA66_07375 [Actinomycetota bacterium]
MDWDYDWTKFFAGVDVVLMGRKTLEHALKMFPSKAKQKIRIREWKLTFFRAI